MKTRLKEKRTWLVLGAAAVILAILGLMLLRPGDSDAQAQAETAEAFVGDLAASATASGTVTARRGSSLSADTTGRVTAVNVRVGDLVSRGDALIQLETDDLALNIAAAEQALRLQEASLAGLLEAPSAATLASAEAAVRSAQANLDELRSGPTEEEITAAQADVRAADASVNSSAAQYSQTQDAITTADIASAEVALASAEANLKSLEIQYTRNPDPDNLQANTALAEARQDVASAQARLDQLRAGPDSTQLNNAQANLAAAQAQRDATAVQFEQLTAGPTQAELASAESQLAQAQASLAGLLEGPSDEDVAAAEAAVERARLDLANVRDALEAATIRAPFDGVVTAVNIHEGELAGGSVAEVMDFDSLEVVLQVDEVDIGEIAIGQPATVTLETWPETEIPAEVVGISPAPAAPDGALISYNVRLSLSDTALPIRAGMTANANLITAEKTDVLLVSNRAIRADRSSGIYTVNRLLPDGTTESVEIQIGLRDSRYTEIRSGLSAGDQLVIGNDLPMSNFQGGPPEDGGFGG